MQEVFVALSISPTYSPIVDSRTSVPPPLPKNWDGQEVDSLFHELGGFVRSDNQIVIRSFGITNNQRIEELVTSSHPSREIFIIVKHAQCYVNRSIQDYFIVYCSTPVLSSVRLRILREQIHHNLFLPAAVKGKELCYFAPDMLHVQFKREYSESDIENWVQKLDLIYYPHRQLGSKYKTAVVHLTENQNIVSVYERIQCLHESVSVQLHELPNSELT